MKESTGDIEWEESLATPRVKEDSIHTEYEEDSEIDELISNKDSTKDVHIASPKEESYENL